MAGELTRGHGFVVVRDGDRNLLNVYSREDGARHSYELRDQQVLNLARDLLQLVWHHMKVETR